MNRNDVAIVVNTCPKYFYLLDACFGLIRRYADECKWPIYLATESTDPLIETITRKHNIQLLQLPFEESDFLQSRAAAMKMLPKEIQYVLPLQEDFLLERVIDAHALSEALQVLDKNPMVQGIRLMPCPGGSLKTFVGNWQILGSDDLLFSYQATLWRKDLYTTYMTTLIRRGLEDNQLKPLTAEWNTYCIRQNPAETFLGLSLLKSLFRDGVYLCWPRKAAWANAVYWSPWPYRPTAVVGGILQQWAKELIRREGFNLRET
jgi:hypothetical protein